MEDRLIDNDLKATIRELADCYEELSLLYRLSSELSGNLSVEDICNRIVAEVTEQLEVKTAVVMLIEEGGQRLYTKSFKGSWNIMSIDRGGNIVWNAINEKKDIAVCDLMTTEFRDDFPGISSILICPLLGKKRPLGAIIAADKKSKEEFYSYDTKLIMAISTQAALLIENATLYEELEEFFIGSVKALVRALEANSSWTVGHSERVTDYATAIAEGMAEDSEFIERLRICCLLHDIGKIGIPVMILDKHGTLDENESRAVLQHPLNGARMLEGIRAFKDIVAGIRHHHERWDGNGIPHGLKGNDIPLMARIIAVADAFDAMLSDRPYRKKRTMQEAVEELRNSSGSQFDPQVVDTFIKTVIQFSLLHQGVSP